MADVATPEVVSEKSVSPKKGKTSKAAKKPRVAPSHPKTADMVNSAITNLKERGGSSLQAIKKYVASNYKVDVEKLSPFIKKYLKSAVASGALVQTKGKGASGSFKLNASSGKTEKKAAGKKVKKATSPKKASAKSKASPKKSKPAGAKTAKPKKKSAAKPAKKPSAAGEKKKKSPAASKPKKAAKSPKKEKKAKAPKKPKSPKPKKASGKKAAPKK